MRYRFIAPVSLAAVAALLCTCRGCSDPGPTHILDLPGADCRALLLVPSLEGLAAGVDGFVTRATEKAGRKAVLRLRAGLVQQLDFDPLDPATHAKAGIDTKASALLFVEAGHREPVLALGVTNRDSFDAALRTVIARTDGANKHTTAKRHGREVHELGRPFGAEVVPVVSWSHVGRFVLLARASGEAAFDAVLSRLAGNARAQDDKYPRPSTLRTHPAYQRVRAKVPDGDILLFVRGRGGQDAATTTASPAQGEADAGALAPAPSGASMTSVRVGAAGVAGDVFLGVEAEGVDLGKALASEAPLPLANRVEPDAAAVLLTRAASERAVAALRAHPSAWALARRALTPLGRSTGLDVEKEILPLLAGPVTIGVHVADLSSLFARSRSALPLGPDLGQLLSLLNVAVTAEVRDPVAMRALLERSQAALAQRGVKIRRREATFGESSPVAAVIFEPDRDNPTIGWAVMGEQYVWGGGAGRLERTLALLAGGGSDLAKQLEPGLGGELASEPGGAVLIVRADALAAAASKITLGEGLAARIGAAALFGSAIEIVRTLGDLVVRAHGERDGLRFEMRERITE